MIASKLTDQQERLFQCIESGEFTEGLSLLNDGVDLNCVDSTGMSPLSAAAYKGNIEFVKACIKRGADVNTKQHEHGYTPLMFAALAGKPELCRILMDSGAYSHASNSIGKTACELAAFVGQHECVSIINNHVSIDDVDRFLHPKGLQSEERFPENLAQFIHNVVSSHVVHPVALIFQFTKFPGAILYRKKILYVIDRVFESQLRSKCSNEVMSLKLWIILHILREVYKYIDEHSGKEPTELAIAYAKYLLRMEPDEQVRSKLDSLLRGAIVSFPYHQSLLFETMVKALSKSKYGERPAAYDFIIQGLFGQRLLAVSKFCATCGASSAKKRCPNCRLPYCSQECQKFDWSIHKKCCESISNWYEVNEEEFLSLTDIQTKLEDISGGQSTLEVETENNDKADNSPTEIL